MEEIWKNVVGYEGFYEVSNFGNIKRVGGFRGVNKAYLDNYYLKHKDNGKGYFRVKLSVNSQPKMIMVHRIIAEAFLPMIKNKNIVNHKDGNKKNNALLNLEWCTQSENCIHASKIGLLSDKKGEKHPKSKLTNKDVLTIRSLDEDNFFRLAKEYNVSYSTIMRIISRKSWSHI